jgi:hypothetical protein
MSLPPQDPKKEKPHYSYLIVGVAASIFLYISSWELLSLLIPKDDRRAKIQIYVGIFIASLLAIFWLAKTNPKSLR